MMPLNANQKRNKIKFALQADDPEKIDEAIKAGATITDLVHEDLSPLHYAIYHGKSKAALHLIELGADINEISNNDTPLMHAAYHKMDEVCLKLIERGADVNIRTIPENTAFSCAAEAGLRSVCLEIAKRVDVHELSEDKNTPLHLACIHGYEDVAQTLIERGADLHTRSNLEKTPFSCAADNNHLALCKTLFAMKVDINVPDYEKHTPLYTALSLSNNNMSRFLLRCGATHPKRLNYLLQPVIDNMMHNVAIDFGGTINEGICLNKDGTVTDSVLNACATGQLYESVIEPLRNSQDPEQIALCEKILETLPENWKNHYSGMIMQVSMELDACKLTKPTLPNLEQRQRL